MQWVKIVPDRVQISQKHESVPYSMSHETLFEQPFPELLH